MELGLNPKPQDCKTDTYPLSYEEHITKSYVKHRGKGRRLSLNYR